MSSDRPPRYQRARRGSILGDAVDGDRRAVQDEFRSRVAPARDLIAGRWSVDCCPLQRGRDGVRTRGLFALIVMLAGGVPAVAGCTTSARGAPGKAVWASPSDPVPVSAPPALSTYRPSSDPSPSGPPHAPGSRSPAPTGTRGAGSGWPPWCRLADLRFATAVATGAGQLISGSVLLTNVSGRRCMLGTYLILRWRDVHGTVLPVTVTHVNGPVPPALMFSIKPGETALASLYWNRYQSLNSTETCPPFPATFDVWLPPTVEDPHPQQGPAARVTWFTGDNASICGGTVKLQPIDRHP